MTDDTLHSAPDSLNADILSDIPDDILALLGDAKAAYSGPELAEAALLAALEQAPDNLSLRIAAIPFISTPTGSRRLSHMQKRVSLWPQTH